MFDMKNSSSIDAAISFKVIPADKITPIKILESLGAKVLLESAYAETGKGKYSIVLLNEAFTIYKKDNSYFLKNPDNRNFKLTGIKGGFLSLIKEFRDRAPDPGNNYDKPIPLGGIGYLGYEFFAEIEKIEFKSKTDDRDIYESAFMFGRSFMIFDHYHDEALICAVQYRGEIDPVNLEETIDNIIKKIGSISEKSNNILDNKVYPANIVNNRSDKQNFIDNVKFIKDEIYKGNLLQCVPSRRIEIETEINPLTAYSNLRMKNPSPYMLYFNFGDFTLFGASPEMMIKIKDRKIVIGPIAGTRPRGKTKAEDMQFETELKSDVKENAEHLMLVDLARNDIGRVCSPGTVKVTAQGFIERYSSVMHLVSTVEGEIAEDKTAEDAIRATFPAGTVSGAAKIQAIKTIDMVETCRRGPYAGLVGYFEKSGDFDSCIAIRCAVAKGNKMWVQAGAGIVFDSVPEKEFEETENKAKAVLRAIGIECK